jgi:hypothetical protein
MTAHEKLIKLYEKTIWIMACEMEYNQTIDTPATVQDIAYDYIEKAKNLLSIDYKDIEINKPKGD